LSKKRIAVCLFGEPRSIGTTSKFIKSFFECDDVEVDYFCHSWTTNTCRWYFGKDDIYNIELNSEEQKEEVILGDVNKVTEYLNQVYNPKKILVEDYITYNKKYSAEKLESYGLPYTEQIPGGTGQFVSTEKSINLKKKYEKENNFKYDVVYRIRYDTALEVSPHRNGFFDSNTPKKDIILQEGLLTDNIILVNALRLSDFLKPEISDHGPYIGLSGVHDKFVRNLSKQVWIYYYNLRKHHIEYKEMKDITYETYEDDFAKKYLYSKHLGGGMGLEFEGLWALQFMFTNIDSTIYRGIYHNLVRCGQPEWITDVKGVNNYHAFLRFKVYTHHNLKDKLSRDKYDYMMEVKYDPEVDWIKDVEEFVHIIWTDKTGMVSVYSPERVSKNKLINILEDIKEKK